jgi:hypothetical protein
MEASVVQTLPGGDLSKSIKNKNYLSLLMRKPANFGERYFDQTSQFP